MLSTCYTITVIKNQRLFSSLICLSLRTSLCSRSYIEAKRKLMKYSLFWKKAHGNFNVRSRPFIAKAAVETCRRTSLAFEAWKPELHTYYTVVVYTTYICSSSEFTSLLIWILLCCYCPSRLKHIVQIFSELYKIYIRDASRLQNFFFYK